MQAFDKAQELIFFDVEPNEAQKKVLRTIVELAEARLLAKLPPKSESIPDALTYIVVELAVKRFNRIGSEGMTTEEVEGHRMDFGQNDFAEFEADIAAWIDAQNELSAKVVRFL